MKKNEIILVLVIVLGAVFFIKCSQKFDNRKLKALGNSEDQIEETFRESQVTKLSDAIDDVSKKNFEKDIITELTVGRSAVKMIEEGFSIFYETNSSIDKVYDFFEEMGARPLMVKPNDMNPSAYVKSSTSVNGLRYFFTEYEEEGTSPKLMSFELEPFKGAYSYAVDLVAKSFKHMESAEPCYTSVDNYSAFMGKNREFILYVKELTLEDLDLDSPTSSRLKEDVGSVRVVLSKRDFYHGGDECMRDEEKKSHDHSSE